MLGVSTKGDPRAAHPVVPGLLPAGSTTGPGPLRRSRTRQWEWIFGLSVIAFARLQVSTVYRACATVNVAVWRGPDNIYGTTSRRMPCPAESAEQKTVKPWVYRVMPVEGEDDKKWDLHKVRTSKHTHFHTVKRWLPRPTRRPARTRHTSSSTPLTAMPTASTTWADSAWSQPVPDHDKHVAEHRRFGRWPMVPGLPSGLGVLHTRAGGATQERSNALNWVHGQTRLGGTCGRPEPDAITGSPARTCRQVRRYRSGHRGAELDLRIHRFQPAARQPEADSEPAAGRGRKLRAGRKTDRRARAG